MEVVTGVEDAGGGGGGGGGGDDGGAAGGEAPVAPDGATLSPPPPPQAANMAIAILSAITLVARFMLNRPARDLTRRRMHDVLNRLEPNLRNFSGRVSYQNRL